MKNFQMLQEGLPFKFNEEILMSGNCEIKLKVPEFDIYSKYPKRYFTINETATILDRSIRSIYNLTLNRKLKASRFGTRRVFYERHELIKSLITFNL